MHRHPHGLKLGMHARAAAYPVITQCTGLARKFSVGKRKAAMRLPINALQAQQLLLELQAGILQDASLQDKQRARICTALAEADKCLVDGSDEFLQLLHVASVAQQAIQGAA